MKTNSILTLDLNFFRIQIIYLRKLVLKVSWSIPAVPVGFAQPRYENIPRQRHSLFFQLTFPLTFPPFETHFDRSLSIWGKHFGPKTHLQSLLLKHHLEFEFPDHEPPVGTWQQKTHSRTKVRRIDDGQTNV